MSAEKPDGKTETQNPVESSAVVRIETTPPIQEVDPHEIRRRAAEVLAGLPEDPNMWPEPYRCVLVTPSRRRESSAAETAQSSDAAMSHANAPESQSTTCPVCGRSYEK